MGSILGARRRKKRGDHESTKEGKEERMQNAKCKI
jgi:hypothetical protein